MSLNRWDARRDAAESPIVRALRQVGADVYLISAPGMCDALVLFRGKIFMLDVKRPKDKGQSAGTLTVRQAAMIERGWPLRIVHTEAEALEAIGVVTK